MRARDLIGTAALAAIAAGSWYLATSLQQAETTDDVRSAFSGHFYLRSARIMGMDDQGNLLYEIEADYGVQREDQRIELQDVQLKYSPTHSIPWTINADEAIVALEPQHVILRGHVRVLSSEGFGGQETEIRTSYLELEPELFRAETDARVQIRVGARSLTATGMLALLREDRLQLKSNVRGRFLP